MANEIKLSKRFLNKYPDTTMEPLGSFVYYRTYSRWLPEQGRRETWKETVQRAVEYNVNLDKSGNTTKKEAEELFDTIFNLKGFLSGRTFWVGGTQSVFEHPLSNFNCSFITIDSFIKLKELFYALMLGCGVGFRCMAEDVEQLPQVRNVQLIHKRFTAVKKYERLESTALTFEGDMAVIHVGDSKGGWCQALDFYFKLISENEYKHISTVLFDYDSVRPKGERLKKFGGTASGYQSLKRMFEIIDRTIQARLAGAEQGTLHSVDVLDFATSIAENTQVGGVRRSALIGLMDSDDNETIEAKNELYSQDENGNWIVNEDLIHRRNSNNTIIHWEKPDRERWHYLFEQQRYSGEPGFYNGAEAKRRNPHFKGTNPCGEILLDDRGQCNLVTNNVMAHIYDDGHLDIKGVLKTHKLLARASYRLTLVTLELKTWDVNQKRDRLLGVSLTGWQDMVNAVDLSKAEQKRILFMMREAARTAADELADSLGTSHSLLVTTVKPEGTLSLLPTVSSGLHFSHSEYYIRRIRIAADNALVKVCQELGYPIHPEVGSTMATAHTLVIEFPVQSPKGRTKYEVGAIEQLEIYAMFMKYYVDHNASITVSVREHEWADVEQWLYDNWDSAIGISFLSLDDNFYQLAPLEAIDKEKYEDMVQAMKPFDAALLLKYEQVEAEEEDAAPDVECAGGVCPVR